MAISEEFHIDEDGRAVKKPFLSKGVYLYLGAMFFGILMQASAKLALEHVDQFVALQLRMAITSLICGARLGKSIFGKQEYWKTLYLRGFLGFVVVSSTFYSLKYMALPDVTAIGFLYPLISTGLAAIVLKECLTIHQCFASLIGFLGVLIISQPRLLAGSGLAVAAALAAVAVSSCVAILLRKMKEVPPLITVGNSAVIAAILSTIVISVRAIDDGFDYPTDWRSWGLITCMGIFGFIRQYLNAASFASEEVSILANWKYTQLVWAVLLEVAFWGDLPGLWTIVGSVVVLGAVLYGQASARRKQEEEDTKDDSAKIFEIDEELGVEPAVPRPHSD